MPSSNHSRRQDRLHWLAEIYRTYAADLQYFISHKVGDPTVAEDLTSTVFLKALRWLRQDQSADRVRGWLYATARTTIVDHWQAQRQLEMHSLSGLEEQLLGSDDTAFANQQVERRVHYLLSLLPERDRRVLTLPYLQGYSAAEIAKALGTSAGYIRVLHLRALRRAAQVETMERNRYRMQEHESPCDSFARFLAPESRRALDLAREEMLALSHWWLGTEQLLWGLASEGSLASFLTPLRIRYVQEDLSAWTALPNTFDAVIANMVFMDIPDYLPALRACIALLKNGGSCISSLLHPCFEELGAQWKERSNKGMLTSSIGP